MTDNPEIGKIEILWEVCVEPEYYKWVAFSIPICFSYIRMRGKFPKARVWNGSEWVRTGIRDHIQGILGTIDEDMEEGEGDLQQFPLSFMKRVL